MKRWPGMIVGVVLMAWGGFAWAITITNYREGQVIRYPVLLLCGTAGEGEESLTVVNTSSTRDTRQLGGIIHKGQFKAMAELVAGENRLVLRSRRSETKLTLIYKPQTNHYFVRVVYFTDKTGDTRYQTPFAADPQNYAAKLDTALKLMQTFTAERMNDLSLGRRTFNLELDEHGKVKVHLFKGSRFAADYQAMDGRTLYARIRWEMQTRFPSDRAKNLVLPAFTRWDPTARKALAHTALGGTGQALLGSGNLFVWPGKLADVQSVFSDGRRIDTARCFNDSAGRGTMWGAAATSLGACLHELGHNAASRVMPSWVA